MNIFFAKILNQTARKEISRNSARYLIVEIRFSIKKSFDD